MELKWTDLKKENKNESNSEVNRKKMEKERMNLAGKGKKYPQLVIWQRQKKKEKEN